MLKRAEGCLGFPHINCVPVIHRVSASYSRSLTLTQAKPSLIIVLGLISQDSRASSHKEKCNKTGNTCWRPKEGLENKSWKAWGARAAGGRACSGPVKANSKHWAGAQENHERKAASCARHAKGQWSSQYDQVTTGNWESAAESPGGLQCYVPPEETSLSSSQHSCWVHKQKLKQVHRVGKVVSSLLSALHSAPAVRVTHSLVRPAGHLNCPPQPLSPFLYPGPTPRRPEHFSFFIPTSSSQWRAICHRGLHWSSFLWMGKVSVLSKGLSVKPSSQI